ncbi:MAG: hypothetical protein CBC24_06300 [Candidatus Pelagibacter sp. TMED64]|nr:hypothetical protein [Candidatus Pelagibacter sp.]OUU65041.1 MAG: hypothetical protein CBC24_06300 [Candidatus Pelagibacter sp. TMED64]|tara:strand:- start:27 stop:509 length:483 start_codon:yes stop_codon:yes gene_type:complete
MFKIQIKKINYKGQLFLIFIILFLFQNISIALEEKKFLSLKKDKVFVRQGHSFEYPVKYIYKKKYLPLLVLDSWNNFRKIKDFENNEGWIHISQLSKKKTAINIKDNSLLFKNSTIYSEPLAKISKGKILIIKKCKKVWCKVGVDEYVGWVKKKALWGRI